MRVVIVMLAVLPSGLAAAMECKAYCPEETCCTWDVTWNVGIEGGLVCVSGDGRRLAREETVGDGLEVWIRITDLEGRTERRILLAARRDCPTPRIADGGVYECVPDRKTPGRVAQANAFLRRGKYRALSLVRVRLDGTLEPNKAGVQASLKDGVLRMSKKGQVFLRRRFRTIPSENPEHCREHTPNLAAVWIWRGVVLALVGYAGGDMCRYNPPPEWVGPVRMPR